MGGLPFTARVGRNWAGEGGNGRGVGAMRSAWKPTLHEKKVCSKRGQSIKQSMKAAYPRKDFSRRDEMGLKAAVGGQLPSDFFVDFYCPIFHISIHNGTCPTMPSSI
ncbi:MAG: hypothetical protein N3D11_11875 [Candidatus Sumerlaeia bacterium]|nr:hypothetical protein [Candidatus Sumerlaeia bacterium]